MKDELFLRGATVPMTKEAVRALVLSKLDLRGAGHLIDVGAGTGSVSIEAALLNPQLRVTAIEQDPVALALLEENRRRFDCPNLRIVAGRAPLPAVEPADAVFIGGSGGNLRQLIDWSFARLRPAGRLVMTFILHDNLAIALAQLAQCGAATPECQLVQVSALTALGDGRYFKPQNPVFVISCNKDPHHG